jgi:HPt (histidine-containing phosphotransfer) domain-containing protein
MQDFVAKPVRRKELLRAILANVVWHGSEGAERPVITTTGPIAPETASPKPVAVDPAAIAELCQEIGAEGLQLATEAFFQDAEGRLDELTVLRSGDDRAAIGRAAHAIKGAAATIGLAEMAEIARTLEHDAETMDRAALDSTVLSLRRAYADARAALLVLLPTLNATGHPVTESALRA